jgi:hypothetical protein
MRPGPLILTGVLTLVLTSCPDAIDCPAACRERLQAVVWVPGSAPVSCSDSDIANADSCSECNDVLRAKRILGATETTCE